MNIKKQYDIIGKDYIDGQKNYYSGREDEPRMFIRKNLPSLKGKIILDAGCGAGSDVLIYEKLGASEVYGIDTSEFMVEQAKKNVPNPERILLGDLENIPFKEEFFDIVIGRFSLHYLDSLEKAYSEISRVLKKGGLMIMIVDHPLRGIFLQKVKDYKKKETIEVPVYNNEVPLRFPSHTLKEYFSENFFKLFNLERIEETDSTGISEEHSYSIPGCLAFKAVKK